MYTVIFRLRFNDLTIDQTVTTENILTIAIFILLNLLHLLYFGRTIVQKKKPRH